MLKLTKTGIGLLTRQYRSVLHKCFLINHGIWDWVMHTVSNAAEAVDGVINTLTGGTSKNCITQFLDVLEELSNSLPRGLMKTSLLATVATVVMLPSASYGTLGYKIEGDAIKLDTHSSDYLITGTYAGSGLVNAGSLVFNTLYIKSGEAFHLVATQNWVNNQGFLKSADLSGYITESDLSDLIPDLDAEERYIFDTINSWNLASQSYVDSAVNNISFDHEGLYLDSGTYYYGGRSGDYVDTYVRTLDNELHRVENLIPTNTNQLTNGAGFITSSALNGYATQQWVGQQGYLTEHQDISGKANKSTTLAGYGITDAYTKTEADNKFLTSHQSLTNYYTKNESDENSKRANLTTQKGDTLNKASNTFSAMAENVPATKLRYNNKPTITGTNSTEFSLRGILNRKRFKMLDNLSTNGCIVANDNTTIFIEYKKEA